MEYQVTEHIQAILKSWQTNFSTISFDLDSEEMEEATKALNSAVELGVIDNAMVETLYMLALDNIAMQDDDMIKNDANILVHYFNNDLIPFVQKESL